MIKHKGNRIIPQRIRQARLIRGLTIQELAEKLSVTRQAISQYELGQTVPSAAILKEMVRVLEFPLAFFYKPVESDNLIDGDRVLFRSYASANKKEKEQQVQRANLLIEIYKYLSQFIEFPKVNLPDLSGFDIENLTDETIEKIALHVRKSWGLGLGPISNVTLLLEKNGFIITRNEIGQEKIDGFSYMLPDGRPIIFLSADKESAVRTRFDVIHELAHILFHQGIEKEFIRSKKDFDKIEEEAYKFAAAFLLPAESFLEDLVSISLEHFILLKARWKVSISSMVRRCRDLGVLSDSQYTYLMKQISQRKWRKREPLDDELEPEQPVLLKRAVEKLFDEGILTSYQLIEDLRMPIEEIESLTNLEPGTLSNQGQVIPINVKKFIE